MKRIAATSLISVAILFYSNVHIASAQSPGPDPAVAELAKQVAALQQQMALIIGVAAFLGILTATGLWSIYRGAKRQIEKAVAQQVTQAKKDMEKRMDSALLSLDGRHYPVFVSNALGAESQPCQNLLKELGFSVVQPLEQNRLLSWPESILLAGVFVLKPATAEDLKPFLQLLENRKIKRRAVGLVIYADAGQLPRDKMNLVMNDFFPWTFANNLATVPTAVFNVARLLDARQLSPV